MTVKKPNCGFENFVFAGDDAGDGGFDADVGLDADPLELAAVGVADVLAAEGDRDAAGHRGAGYAAVRAGGGGADERDAAFGGFFEGEATVLRCADGVFIDQDDDATFVFPEGARLNALIKAEPIVI